MDCDAAFNGSAVAGGHFVAENRSDGIFHLIQKMSLINKTVIKDKIKSLMLKPQSLNYKRALFTCMYLARIWSICIKKVGAYKLT